MLSINSFQILLFLIPGFISDSVLNLLIVRKEKKEWFKIIEALIFSMLIYTIYALFFRKSPIEIQTIDNITSYIYNTKQFLVLFTISILLPIIIAIFINNDWHMWLARKCKITNRTSRNSIWCDVFYTKNNYIIINFEDGTQLSGWPAFYSDEPENSYIYLEKPAWVEEGEYKYLEVDGILVTPSKKIESIYFERSSK